MPTYSYKCPNGHEYTKLQKITDKTRAKCPECGLRGERLITGGGGLIFKGSGFYITDYKRKPQKEGEGAAAEKTDKSAKTDKKDAPKTDTGKAEKPSGKKPKGESS